MGSQPKAKIFGIGLDKTGTWSLHHALELLGYRSLHGDSKILGQVVRAIDEGKPLLDHIDGDFDHPSTSLFQPGTEIVLIGHRRADGGQRLPRCKRHQRTKEGVLAFEAAVEGANRHADALTQILDREFIERTLAQHHGGGFQQRDRGFLAAALLCRQHAREVPNRKPVYRL